jgi:hypothetical protein
MMMMTYSCFVIEDKPHTRVERALHTGNFVEGGRKKSGRVEIEGKNLCVGKSH